MHRGQFLVVSTASFVLVSAPSIAVALRRVAIVVSGDETIQSSAVNRLGILVSGALLRTGHFQVVDRQRLEEIKQEQGFSNSAYADPKTAAALGKITGASRLLHIDASAEDTSSSGSYISRHSMQITASYTLIGVDSARVLAAGSASGSGEQIMSAASSSNESQSALQREALQTCADDLVSQLDQAT